MCLKLDSHLNYLPERNSYLKQGAGAYSSVLLFLNSTWWLAPDIHFLSEQNSLLCLFFKVDLSERKEHGEEMTIMARVPEWAFCIVTTVYSGDAIPAILNSTHSRSVKYSCFYIIATNTLSGHLFSVLVCSSKGGLGSKHPTLIWISGLHYNELQMVEDERIHTHTHRALQLSCM